MTPRRADRRTCYGCRTIMQTERSSFAVLSACTLILWLRLGSMTYFKSTLQAKGKTGVAMSCSTQLDSTN